MRPVPRYLGYLVLIAMAGFAGAGFYATRQGIDDLREINKDNILWSATQTEWELLRLQYSLARLAIAQTPDALEEMRGRLDIFWSRIFMMETGGRVGESMRLFDEESGGSLTAIWTYLQEVDPILAGLRPDDVTTVERIVGEVEALQKGLRDYTLWVVRRDTIRTADVWTSIQKNAQIAAVISLAAVFVSVLSLGLILRENRRQREAAEVSRRSADEAELANRAKSRFLSMISHELRNPLNGIIGPLALLDQSDIAARQRTLVSQARQCGQAMVQMLGGLLDYAEMQDGRFRLEAKPFQLRAFAEAVRGSLLGQGARGIPVELRPEVPDRVEGDLDRFRQIFVHLCEYVLEAADPDSVRLIFDHDGQSLIGDIDFAVDGPTIDWKLDLLMGLSEVSPDQVSTDALRPLIARGLIFAGEGVLTLIDGEDRRRAIRVTLPARAVRLEQVRVYLETRSAALKTIYQAALRSDRVVFAPPGTAEPVDVVLVDSTSVGEESLMSGLRSRFPGALFVSLGHPQAPDFFDDVLETPSDMGLLRSSILGRLTSR